MAARDSSSTGPARRVPRGTLWALPKTVAGWWAVGLGVGAVLWVIAGQRIQDAVNPRACPDNVLCTGGREYVFLAPELGVPASVAGLIALIRLRERSILVFLTVVPAVLFTVFWLLFAAGELLFPH